MRFMYCVCVGTDQRSVRFFVQCVETSRRGVSTSFIIYFMDRTLSCPYLLMLTSNYSLLTWGVFLVPDVVHDRYKEEFDEA